MQRICPKDSTPNRNTNKNENWDKRIKCKQAVNKIHTKQVKGEWK